MCNSGYFGQSCKTPCPSGTYGFQCGGFCSPKCSNEECDHVHGCPEKPDTTTPTTISGVGNILNVTNNYSRFFIMSHVPIGMNGRSFSL